MPKYELQVEKEHYFNKDYNHKGRWLSFFYQLQIALKYEPKSILEIGPGSGWVAHILKDFGIKTETVDIDDSLDPDYVAEVSKLPIKDNKYDIVCAYEVLEHMPFEEFVGNLKEMRRVSNRYVVISLPDHRRTLINLRLKIPFVRLLTIFIKIPSFKKHEFDGQHYWEIGKKGFGVKTIVRAIEESGLKIVDRFVPQDADMNHYFVMEKI